jgi:hypothetical protein
MGRVGRNGLLQIACGRAKMLSVWCLKNGADAGARGAANIAGFASAHVRSIVPTVRF